jgi:hypothetical protein
MSLRSHAQIKFTPTVVAEMLNYLKHGVIPAGLSVSSARRFQKRCAGFTYYNNTLVFDGKSVIPSDKTEETIKRAYDQKDNVGKGINQMTAWLQTYYLGISRKMVQEVMKKQIVYQLSFHQRHMAARTFQITQPLQYWAIDLVDVHKYATKNKNNTFIFSCIDLFSRFVWFFGIKQKTPDDVAEAFNKVVNYNLRFNPVKQYPAHVVSDNGLEWAGALKAYFIQHGIRHLKQPTYRPQANIENANRELRRLLRTIYVRNNSLVWINSLGDIMDSINSNYSKILKSTPESIMTDYFMGGDLTNEANLNLEHNKSKFTSHYNQNKLQVRDRVRIRMSSLFSNLRQIEKSGFVKGIFVRYTPSIFIIVGVHPPPRGSLGYNLYSVIGPNRKLLRTRAGNARLFNASELQKIPPDSVSHLTMKDAAKLNGVKFEEELTEKEDEPVVDEEPPPPKPEKSATDFKSSAEWRRALVGKTFTDADGVQGEVVDVDYKKGDGYRVHYGDIKKRGSNGKYLVKDQFYQTLGDFLEDAQSEPWFTPEYAEVMNKLKK